MANNEKVLAGKTLINNWVEERSVQSIDIADSQKLQKGRSHRQILSDCSDGSFSRSTEVRDNYKLHDPRRVSDKGVRQLSLERALYEQARAEVTREMNPPPEPTDYRSVTAKDFNIDGFVSQCPPASRPHNYVQEQPVTFWTENARTAHGVTQIKTGDTPFRRNAAFSTPVDQRYDNIEPYQIEAYPKM